MCTRVWMRYPHGYVRIACTCAFRYFNTYMCMSCINEPQGTIVRDERNEMVFHRYWTSVHHVDYTRIRKPECLYFCLALLLYRFIFIPFYFHSPRSRIRLRLHPISAFSRTFRNERVGALVSLHIFRFSLLSSVSPPPRRVSTRTEPSVSSNN